MFDVECSDVRLFERLNIEHPTSNIERWRQTFFLAINRPAFASRAIGAVIRDARGPA
jgi:hypothetical protein